MKIVQVLLVPRHHNPIVIRIQQKTTASSADVDVDISSESGSETETDEDDDTYVVPDDLEMDGLDTSFKRLFYLSHTAQLVVRSLEKLPVFSNALSKARSLSSAIRMSSVATKKLLSLLGKTVVADL
jgi:hypothetical protein